MKSNTARGSLLAVALAALILIMATSSVDAQDKPADNMNIVLEKLRADKKLLVSENMGLTETEAQAFWPVYEKYQNELFLIRARTARLITNYADAYEKMTNDTAKKLMNESFTIETLGLKLRQAYLPKFRKALPEVKVARYYQIENKINAILMYELAGKIPLVKTNVK